MTTSSGATLPAASSKSLDARSVWSNTMKPHELPYPTLSPDTDPHAEAVQLEIYRRMSPGRKIELVFEAIEMNRALILAGLRKRFPKAGEQELRRRLFGICLGEELATKAYGPLEDPD